MCVVNNADKVFPLLKDMLEKIGGLEAGDLIRFDGEKMYLCGNDKYSESCRHIEFKDRTLLSYLPKEGDYDVYIPDGIQEIAAGIFDWARIPADMAYFERLCEMKIRTIHIPSSVKNIQGGAFCDAIGVKEIYIDPDSPAGTVVDGVLFNKDKTVLLCCPAHYSKEETYIVPDGVKVIEEAAFINCRFKTIILPDSVEEIKNSAFALCNRLTGINIPDSVVRLGYNAFQGCTDANIDIGENCKVLTINEHGVFSKDGRVLMIAFSGTDKDYPSSVPIHNEDGRVAIVLPSNGEKYIVPNGVTEIVPFAFGSGISEIVIPEGVKCIADHTFDPGFLLPLKSIVLPNSVTYIGKHAFGGCLGLEKINMSKGIRKIAEHAFEKLYSLKEIELPANVEIGYRAFYDCNKDLVIKAPKGSATIEYAKKNGIKYEEI